MMLLGLIMPIFVFFFVFPQEKIKIFYYFRFLASWPLPWGNISYIQQLLGMIMDECLLPESSPHILKHALFY